MAEPVMSFDAVVRRENFIELCTATSRRVQPDLVRRTAIASIVVGALALASVILVDRTLPRFTSIASAALYGFCAGALLVTLGWYYLGMRQRNSQVRGRDSYFGPRRFRLDDEGVHVEGSFGRSLIRWSAMMELTEASNTFLLWTDPGAAVMVPKDAFAGDAARAAFVEFVNKHIPTSE